MIIVGGSADLPSIQFGWGPHVSGEMHWTPVDGLHEGGPGVPIIITRNSIVTFWQSRTNRDSADKVFQAVVAKL